MKSSPLPQIMADYGMTMQDWETRFRYNPQFIADVKHWMDELKKDDGRFRMKAKLQAEELLKVSWKMIHKESTPDNVRADLIAKTVRWAGLEPKAGAVEGGGQDNAFNIIIQMNGAA